MSIDLYTWDTPNGRKISVALEEMGLPYKVYPVDITKGEQMKPEFLAISPNNKIPAIVDPDGPGGQRVSVFESGANCSSFEMLTGCTLYGTPISSIATLFLRPFGVFQV